MTWQETSIAGRVALVAGAGSGIGRDVALALAGHGVNVCLLDLAGVHVRAVADEIAERFEVPVLAAGLDITDAAAVTRIVAHAEQRLGGVDMVVHGLGVDGAQVLREAVVGQMVSRGHGHVVAIREGEPALVTRSAPARSGVVALDVIASPGTTGQAVVDASRGRYDSVP